MSYERPNYTQIPNALLDEHLSTMQEAELRVTLAIARKTFGWHKNADQLSLSQLMELTGMSRQGVINGIEDGLKRGTIQRIKNGQNFIYSLLVNQVDQLNQSTELTTTSQPSRPLLVNQVDTQKKGKEKKESSSRAQKPTAQPHPETQAIIAAYIEVRGKNGINYQKEGSFAKKIAKDGYTPVQVKGCYLWLKSDPWWEDKPVTLDQLFKHMPEYVVWAEKQGLTTSSSELSVIDVDWNTL